MDLQVSHSYIKHYQEIRISSSQFQENYNDGSYKLSSLESLICFSFLNVEHENVRKRSGYQLNLTCLL